MEITKLIISSLTPIVILILGLKLTRKIEKNKLLALKEKEWQVKWADLFFEQSKKFNEYISDIVSYMYNVKQSDEAALKEYFNIKSIELGKIDWNIQNFSQFSRGYHEKLNKVRKQIFDKIDKILKESGGDLDELRALQFEYNQIAKKVHNEILNHQ
jgi:hypothetical protein